MDRKHGAATETSSPTMKMKNKAVDKTITNSTTKNFNKENCESVNGKGSLQTQGGNSNTENSEDTCADNN